MDPIVSTTPQIRSLDGLSREMETNFLAEILKTSGIVRPRTEFSGGPGEEMFSGYLADIYAQKIVDAGGIGLAEHIVRALAAESES